MMLQAVIGEAVGALRTGSFDSRTDRHLSWVPIKLDEEGWGEVVSLLAEALAGVQEIGARAANRLTAGDERGIEAVVSMMGFERSASRGASS